MSEFTFFDELAVVDDLLGRCSGRIVFKYFRQQGLDETKHINYQLTANLVARSAGGLFRVFSYVRRTAELSLCGSKSVTGISTGNKRKFAVSDSDRRPQLLPSVARRTRVKWRD